jgi:hypothetical protein
VSIQPRRIGGYPSTPSSNYRHSFSARTKDDLFGFYDALMHLSEVSMRQKGAAKAVIRASHSSPC